MQTRHASVVRAALCFRGIRAYAAVRAAAILYAAASFPAVAGLVLVLRLGLRTVIRLLFSLCRGLRTVIRLLFSLCRGLRACVRLLLSLCRGLRACVRLLFSFCRGLRAVFRLLFSLYRRLRAVFRLLFLCRRLRAVFRLLFLCRGLRAVFRLLFSLTGGLVAVLFFLVVGVFVFVARGLLRILRRFYPPPSFSGVFITIDASSMSGRFSFSMVVPVGTVCSRTSSGRSMKPVITVSVLPTAPLSPPSCCRADSTCSTPSGTVRGITAAGPQPVRSMERERTAERRRRGVLPVFPVLPFPFPFLRYALSLS